MAITIYKKGTDPNDRTKNIHFLNKKEWQQYKLTILIELLLGKVLVKKLKVVC